MPLINLYGNSQLGKEFYVKSFLNNNIEYIRLYSDDNDKVDIIIEKSTNISLFSPKSVIDLVDFDNWKAAEKRKVLELNIPDNITVFLRTEKQLSKKIELRSFTVPNPWEKSKWIKYIEELLNRESLKHEIDVPEYLFEIVGPNELALYNEIRKLKVLNVTLNVNGIKNYVHKYTVSKLDEFCFMISERKKEVFAMLDDILKDYEPVIVTGALSKHFIMLFDLVLNVNYKEKFKWVEIVQIAKELGIKNTSKIARFLGFKFKDQNFIPLNHLGVYNPEILKEIIKRIFSIDRSIKLGGIFKVELIDFIKHILEEVGK
ncbi:MAG: DNA polymerase III subunit delta [Thermosipho sp. (in: Bacteria)]|nr:DNA polymerase III subunit delta [Thermosipho sp. (in: thermotogales)]